MLHKSKTMKYLFPNFLSDYEQLHKSQLYWISLCQEILEKNLQQNSWAVGGEIPQQNLSLHDSFGLVGGYNFQKTKAFGITQFNPYEYDFEMVAYIEESGRFSEETPTIYLQFNCKLSVESARVFKKLFENWIQPNCGKKELERYIKSLRLNEE